MKYVKAKHLSGGGSFAVRYVGYKDIQKGDIVVNSKNQQLVVVGDVSQAWLDSYGNPKCQDVMMEDE